MRNRERLLAPSVQHAPGQFDPAKLAACIEALGGPRFPAALCALCAEIGGADSAYLSAFFPEGKPVAFHSTHDNARIQAALKLYDDVAYVLDPFFLYFREGGGDAVLRLQEIAPDTFRKSEYYRLFYRAMGLRDECGVMIGAGDAAIFLSLGVHERSRATRPARLREAMPVIAALIRRHWPQVAPRREDGPRGMAGVLERAFEGFGSSLLSPREAEIARLILRGHSSKSIARTLGNSPETIKVHRRRAFAKLGVASQGELFALFIDVLAKTPLGDPPSEPSA